MPDEVVAEDSAPEPEVGAEAVDPTMEVAADETQPEAATPETGTEVEAEPEAPSAPPETPVDNPESEVAEPDPEPAEEPTVAEKQAGYEAPPGLTDHVQNVMVAGSNRGQADRHKSLARNRQIRDEQQAALARTNRPDNA